MSNTVVEVGALSLNFEGQWSSGTGLSYVSRSQPGDHLQPAEGREDREQNHKNIFHWGTFYVSFMKRRYCQ